MSCITKVFGFFALFVSLSLSFRPRLRPGGEFFSHSHLGPPNRINVVKRLFDDKFSENELKPLKYGANYSNPMIYPTDYGADPTGSQDSTAAFKSALAEALTRGSGKTLAYGAKDLGGVTINLAGGDYLISSPLIIPNYYGNMRIIDGTIRASNSFPPNDYLIQIGDASNCNSYQNSCGQDFGFQNLMLDCSLVCAGALEINVMMGVVIGPQVFVYGFKENGVIVNGGHDTSIYESWFGEYSYDSNEWTTAKSNGITFNAPDCYITDTIVFSARIGVQLNEPSTTLKGVHTWNLQTTNNGSGIVINAFQIRISDCYLDYTNLVIIPPSEHVIIEHSFFLYSTLYIENSGDGNNRIDGLSIQHNMCDANKGIPGIPNATFIQVNGNGGDFTALKNTNIKDNMAYGIPRKTSSPTMSLHQSGATQWDFDFSTLLPFPGVHIQRVDYTVMIDSGANIVSHSALLNPNGYGVSIVMSGSTSATVVCTVDQATISYNDGVSY